jgi:hypothetical protein
MVGDVNMFLPNGLEEDGECEIMIAGEATLQSPITNLPALSSVL